MAPMAIKGKKKSKGGAPRRPAAAPRPQVSGVRKHTPFYRTRDGMFIVGIFVLVAIGVVVWLVGNAQKESRELERRQTVVEQFTDQVQPTLTSINDAAEELSAVQALPATPEETDALKQDIATWKTAFQDAQIALSQIFSGPEVDPINQLFNEAMGLYGNSITLLEQLVDSDLPADQQEQIFINFSTQRGIATAMFSSAIGAFDALRAEMELGSSGLSAPAAVAPQQEMPEDIVSPGAEVTIPPSDESHDDSEDGTEGHDESKDGKGSNG